jgi:hypothetical protein
MIREDMVTMSCFHSLNSSGLVKIRDTCHEVNVSISSIRGRRRVTYQASTVCRRVADFTPLQHRKLTLDSCSFLLGGTDDVQSSDSLVVQTGVLGEGLHEAKSI